MRTGLLAEYLAHEETMAKYSVNFGIPTYIH